MHVKGALTNGVTRDEIREIFLRSPSTAACRPAWTRSAWPAKCSPSWTEVKYRVSCPPSGGPRIPMKKMLLFVALVALTVAPLAARRSVKRTRRREQRGAIPICKASGRAPTSRCPAPSGPPVRQPESADRRRVQSASGRAARQTDEDNADFTSTPSAQTRKRAGRSAVPCHRRRTGSSAANRPTRHRSSSIRLTAAYRRRFPKPPSACARRGETRRPRPRRLVSTIAALYDQCITRGVLGSIHAGHLQQRQPDHPGAGHRRAAHEMIHETRFFYTDGRPHINSRIRSLHGRFARALGRRDARGRDDEHVRPATAWAATAAASRSATR